MKAYFIAALIGVVLDVLTREILNAKFPDASAWIRENFDAVVNRIAEALGLRTRR